MKKSLLKLALGGLVLVSTSAIAQNPTLTEDWKYTEDIPAVANARWGVGLKGQVWTNDKSVPQLIYWDKDGKHPVTNAEGAAIGWTGTGIGCDDAGNIFGNTGFPNAVSSTDYMILPAGGNALQELKVTLPEGAVAGRMDYIGRATGNIMSAEGGAFYVTPAKSAAIAKIFVAEGKQDAAKSKVFKLWEGQAECGSDGHAQPIGTDPNADEFVAKAARTNGTFWQYTAEGFKALPKGEGQSTTAGGDAVILNGNIITVNPSGTTYADGFIVCDETGAILASHAESVAATNPYGNALTIEKVDEYTANIYQYVPGRLVAKYTLAFEKPVPPVALAAMNAYAYDINVTVEGENATVTYRLNAPATAVKVQIWNGNTMVREAEGTTLAETIGDKLNNQNTATISVKDLPAGTNVFKVAVESAALTEAAKFSKEYSFYHPASVAIDQNPESPNFGRVYVTEAMPSPATGYHSSNEGQGLYVFDAMINPVKNAAGTYAFKGGQTFPSTFDSGKSSYDPRKIRITKDGRVLISGQNGNGVALYEINPADLEAEWTQVIKGTPNEQYEITTADGQFVAAPNVGFDVKGEGENLQLLMLSSNKTGMAFSYGGYRTDEYNLGTAKTWEATPSKNIDQLSGQFTIAHSSTSVLYDNEGGIWYANSRATAKDTEPTLVHVNAAGEIDFMVADQGNTFYGGGGIAFNKDFTRLAIGLNRESGSVGIIGIFEVNKTVDGKPALKELMKVRCEGMGRNMNDIAWDFADNLYAVGNSGEKFQVYSLPRESGVATVAAASKFNITVEGPATPAELHLVGNVSDLGWDPAKSVVLTQTTEGVYTGKINVTEVGQNFVIAEKIGSWEAINAARYGFATDNADVEVNTTMPIVKVQDGGAMRMPYTGEWDVTVDYKAMTITVQGTIPAPTYPDELYIIGTIDDITQWDPATGLLMDKDATAPTYTYTRCQLYPGDENGNAYFAFTSVLSANWDEVNPNRYGPAVTDTEITSGVAAEIGKNGDTSYTVLANTYDIVVDLEAGTITLTKVDGGVETIENAVAVVGGVGEIRILGDVKATSIYNVNGQAVALNSAEKTFNVASGIYVVVVDGKSLKVMVK